MTGSSDCFEGRCPKRVAAGRRITGVLLFSLAMAAAGCDAPALRTVTGAQELRTPDAQGASVEQPQARTAAEVEQGASPSTGGAANPDIDEQAVPDPDVLAAEYAMAVEAMSSARDTAAQELELLAERLQTLRRGAALNATAQDVMLRKVAGELAQDLVTARTQLANLPGGASNAAAVALARFERSVDQLRVGIARAEQRMAKLPAQHASNTKTL